MCVHAVACGGACRKLKDLPLLFKTTVWQFKIQSWSSTSQVVIIIRVEMPKMVADN